MTARRCHAMSLIAAALLVCAACSDADPAEAVATACKRDGSPARQCDCRAGIARSSVTEEDARGFAAYVRDSAPAPDAAAKLRYDAVLLAVTARCLTVD